jgi:F-type H+-transporting ATPase subunit delta
MTPAALARRYATALFDVTSPLGHAEAADADLQAFAALVASHPELSRLLASPMVPAARKQALVKALLDKSGETSVEVRRLLDLLAERDRLAHLGLVASAFAERLVASHNVVQAEVVTAVPLADGQRSALEAALGQAAGARLRVDLRIDPAIVGGVVARVGSLVFDGSVVTQIARMHQKLLQEA